MPAIPVTPANVQERLDHAAAGDEIVLRPGIYRQRLRMERRNGTATRPIVVRAEPGAILDGGMTAEGYRLTANRLAADVHAGRVPGVPAGAYPGLWPWKGQGQLSLRRCRHVQLVDLEVRGSWPTLIALDGVRDIRIAGARLQDGAFAIAALGAGTAGIAIEGCNWVQDPVPDRLWKRIAWARIHGDPEEDGPVDLPNDWRLFDGDFFRGDGIRGGVRITQCCVSAAFNAIHLFNTADDPDLARDVEVAHCTFRQIRDNVLEAEDCAHNWWFHHNEVIDAHKCFSIEQKRSGWLYIFANRLWFESVPGSADDDHRGGAVIKAAKSFNPSQGGHHVFHNSIHSRSGYIQKGLLTRFRHANNAVRFVRGGEPGHEQPINVLGELAAAPGDIERRFTTAWRQLAISFRNDVMAHGSWPEGLRAAGYPIDHGLGADPGFRDPFGGDLRLAAGSPCRGRAAELRVALPDGSEWVAAAGADIGAWQGERLLDGPELVTTANPVA